MSNRHTSRWEIHANGSLPARFGYFIKKYSFDAVNIIGGNLTIEQCRKTPKPFWLEGELFGVYNSFSTSNSTGRSGAGQQKPYQMMPKMALVFWFLKNNGWRFVFNRRVGALLFIVALFFTPRLFGLVGTFTGSSFGKSKTEANVLENEVVEKVEDSEIKAEVEALIARPDKKMKKIWLSARLAGFDSVSFDLSVVAELDGLLQAVSDRADVELVANPVLVLGDGKKATFNRVEKIPYQTQIIEDSGSQIRTRTVVEFLDVGFNAAVALRETGIESATIDLLIKNSNVTATNGVLPPSTSQDEFRSTVPVKANGVYLVGSFVTETLERSKGFGLRLGHREQKSTRTYQVWLRAHQIASLKTAKATENGRLFDTDF